MRDDQVDVKCLRELVEFHIENGTHGIVAAGTTGESGTLSHQEKLLVIKTVIEQAKERIPVIAGTAMNATKHCVELTRQAMECGAFAALIMTPAYIKPTQEGLYLHYNAIAHAAAIPIILYNVPSRTACDLLPETAARLAKISNIIGIKEATGQKKRLEDILALTDGGLDVYSGDDLTAADWMLHGAKGVISVVANIAPKLTRDMCQAALNGQREECHHLNNKLAKLGEALMGETNPIPSKWALSRLNLMNNELRLPLTPLSQIYQEKIEHALTELDLIR
jgi:4-hydroxy-tetrahydrodipicolinate synthase